MTSSIPEFGGPNTPGARRNPKRSVGTGRASIPGGGGKVRHPAEAQDEILKGTGLLQWLEGIRAHAVIGHDAIVVGADTVHLGIRKASKWPFGVDRLVVARRMRKLILHLAELQMEEARIASLVAQQWRLHCEPVTTQRTGRGEMDVTI
jgi:hypothetical protein